MLDWQTELKFYIEKCLNLGFSENEIRAVLRSVGWSEADVDNGMLTARSEQSLGKDLPPSAVLAPYRNFDISVRHPNPTPSVILSQQAKDPLSRLSRNDNNNFIASRDSKLISAEETPLLLETVDQELSLPSPPNSKNSLLPSVPKVAFSIFLALLAKRIEILKLRDRARAGGRKPLLLFAPRHSALFAIVAAPLPHQILLEAPSWRTIFKLYCQFTVEKIFKRIEVTAVIFMRLGILPLVIFNSLGSAIKRLIFLVGAMRSRTSERRAIKYVSSTPEVELVIGKFPEHIILFDIFKLAGRMFRTRRLRTFLTISGISVGIGTILFLVSFGYGLQNILFERITTEEALLTLDVVPPADNAIVTIDNTMIEKIKEIEGVADVSFMTALNGEMILGESSAAGFIYAIDPSYIKLAGIRLIAGAPADENDNNSVIISSAAAKLLGWSDPLESALGKEMNFAIAVPKGDSGEMETASLNEGYKVVGVVDDSFSVFAYLPIEQIKNKKLPAYSQLKVKVKDTSLLDPVRDQILSQGLLVSMLSETVDQAKKVFNAVKIVLGLFGVITLVVSAIGMLNTMTIALLERTQEVGIMKAVGASNFDVWKLFLAEAVIMGFLGGVGGIAIGFASSTAFNYGINMLARAFGGQSLNLFQTPLWFILTIIAFSSCIGVITGLWPARRASRLDPLDAIRYK